MLHILWMIVKFLLITVGVILGLILLLLLLLLFCPFVYQGSGGKHGKDFSGQAKVSWLFRAIAVVVDFGYKKDIEIDLCLFGVSLRKLKKKREQRKQEKQRKAREKAKAEARKKKKKEEKQIPVESEKNEPKQIPVIEEKAEPEKPETVVEEITGSEKPVVAAEIAESEIPAVTAEISESDMSDVTVDSTEDGSEKLRTADMAVSAEQVVTEKIVEEQPIEEQEQKKSEIPVVTVEELLENSVLKEPEPVAETPLVHDETPVEVVPAEADKSVISEEPEKSETPGKLDQPSESEETPPPGKKQKANLLDLLSKAIGAVFTLPFVAVRKICRFLSSIFGKIKAVAEKVTGKVRGIRDKVDQLLEKAKTWKRFLTDERTLGALKLVKDELFRLLRHIMPRKLYGNVAFGLEDPSAMGAALAVLGATIPIHKNCIEIEPVFEQNYFEGEIGLKGRIYVCVIVWSALKILINKNIHYVYRVLRKKEAM